MLTLPPRVRHLSLRRMITPLLLVWLSYQTVIRTSILLVISGGRIVFLHPVTWFKSRCSSTELQRIHAHVTNNLHAVRTEKWIRRIFAIIYMWRQILKGPGHEGTTFLSQFCAYVITLCLYLYTNFSCRVMKKISKTFHQGAITIVFWVIFAGMAIKPEKLASRKYAKRKNDARKLGKASTLSLSPARVLLVFCISFQDYFLGNGA